MKSKGRYLVEGYAIPLEPKLIIQERTLEAGKYFPITGGADRTSFPRRRYPLLVIVAEPSELRTAGSGTYPSAMEHNGNLTAT
jgi:hypothetical protein